MSAQKFKQAAAEAAKQQQAQGPPSAQAGPQPGAAGPTGAETGPTGQGDSGPDVEDAKDYTVK